MTTESTEKIRRTYTKNSKSAAQLPLSTLLSQVLVAFTIEFDNEGEQRIQHGRRGMAQRATRERVCGWRHW